MAKAINRLTLAIPFAAMAALAYLMQVPNVWDIFDIAGLIHTGVAGGFILAAAKAYDER